MTLTPDLKSENEPDTWRVKVMQKMMWDENEQKTYSNLFHSYLKVKFLTCKKWFVTIKV